MPEGKSDDLMEAAIRVVDAAREDLLLAKASENKATLRQVAISVVHGALLAERKKCHRQIENMMDDFFLIEQRIYDGQIDRARGTAYQGAKEACRILGISPIPTPVTLRRPTPPSSTEENLQHD